MQSEESRPREASGRTRDRSVAERGADWLSGWLIYGMVIFSPWAFGTTQAWSIRVMNFAGYFLGTILLVKWTARRNAEKGKQDLEIENPKSKIQNRKDWLTVTLFVLTVLILLYCLVAAWNARATYSYADSSFDYHDYIPWLPHSYDSARSWSLFWNYLALACSFWAVRDWIQNEDHLSPGQGNPLFSRRWKKLLWVICLNGALVGLEGIVQRTDNTGKLLWLVQPRIHKTAEGQLGPYAYRSNGAQFLNLIWPVAIGLWWSLQQSVGRSKKKRTAHHLLIPAAIIMAAGAIISLSRGGILGAVIEILATVFVLLISNRRGGWKLKVGLMAASAATIGLAAYVNWAQMAERFRTVATDELSGRLRIYRIAEKMIRDYPLFGTGPNTFDPVSQLYLESPDAMWIVQVHNDWLETLATFGMVGSSLIWLALVLALARPLLKLDGIRRRSVFVAFLWIALGGCLLHGAFDFPFQIYSILFLFLVLCAIISALSIRKRT